MGATVEMNLSEVKKLVSKINSYALSASQKQNLLHSIGVEMLDQTIRRFNAERASDGTEWADYKSDDFAAFKSARCASKLVLSGGLLDSLGSDNADALKSAMIMCLQARTKNTRWYISSVQRNRT